MQFFFKDITDFDITELGNISTKCNQSVFYSLESENLEATAQFDFNARSERELSFKKGDTLTLYTQVSNDWWRGALAGREGLIPDKYIMLKIKLVLQSQKILL